MTIVGFILLYSNLSVVLSTNTSIRLIPGFRKRGEERERRGGGEGEERERRGRGEGEERRGKGEERRGGEERSSAYIFVQVWLYRSFNVDP